MRGTQDKMAIQKWGTRIRRFQNDIECRSPFVQPSVIEERQDLLAPRGHHNDPRGWEEHSNRCSRDPSRDDKSPRLITVVLHHDFPPDTPIPIDRAKILLTTHHNQGG
jgi:hypothetical protein